MKNLFAVSLILIFCLSCKKKKENDDDTHFRSYEYPTLITAGIVSEHNNYVDIDPDTVFFFEYPSSGKTLGIDLNQDAICDLQCNFSGSVSPGMQLFDNFITPLEGTEIAVASANAMWADSLLVSDTIDASLNWSNQQASLHSYHYFMDQGATTSGLWFPNANEKYVGVKITKNNIVQYGWLHIRMPDNTHMTIMEYACTVGY